MKKLIAAATLTISVSCFGQATVNLGSVNLSAPQVTAMTWFWQNNTNDTAIFNANTNNVPVPILAKVPWFVSECTNLVLNAVNRKTAIYAQNQKQLLIDAYTTNATKRAQIDTIVNAP